MTPLRAVVITQEDPFYIAEFFRTFFADDRWGRTPLDIAGAWILATLGKERGSDLARRLYGMYGPIDFVRLGARYARKRVGALAHERLGLGTPVTVAQILGRAGIAVARAGDINAPETLEAIRKQRPDVLLSISATQKFSPDLLSLAPRGCFNSHSGALPRFRGMMPTFWTLYEGERDATVTVHQMAERIDAGSIWRQERLPIEASDSLDDVIRKTKRLSARMIWELIAELQRGDVALSRNDEAKKSYYKFPTARDAAVLRRAGRRLL